jgi:hypothetical protein
MVQRRPPQTPEVVGDPSGWQDDLRQDEQRHRREDDLEGMR